MRNTSVRVLNLSGNNMTGSCVTILGDLLRVNTSLAKLYLEWNCVGQCQESFSQLCSGLASNTGLETLDLRSEDYHLHLCDSISLYARNVTETLSIPENYLLPSP